MLLSTVVVPRVSLPTGWCVVTDYDVMIPYSLSSVSVMPLMTQPFSCISPLSMTSTSTLHDSWTLASLFFEYRGGREGGMKENACALYFWPVTLI